ncbi:hypothetical protein CLV84_1036 [Neolewinella xylanilytica]|uniref:Contractile injection system tube protein N-terminal domain-containing protein n=1 Tax=Neolewinella xylanilytica TaxID=1514080 RepID=A0A2S6I9A4_9BACT|nr:hypothetical protein [Neolewinella xylanilytica]PPK88073.1 hypothetical protein CLV84_1036 [Neolewinella xylanilytica]
MPTSSKADRKLRIWAYKDATFTSLVDGLKAPLELTVNPSSYKRKYRPLSLGPAETKLANGQLVEQRVVDPPPESFALDIWFDGTGVIPGPDVPTQIEKLRKYVLLYNGDIHSINFVKLEWGGASGLLFKGQLTDLSIDYQLFDRSGKPLRARATATFTQYIDAATRSSLRRKNSPDLSHIRIAKAGDTLPLMCNRIYGKPDFYIQVARVNGLRNVMALRPGQEILFPPLQLDAGETIQ